MSGEIVPADWAGGILLAGGKSSRMGRDKLSLKIDGETLLERTLRVVRAVVSDVVIAGFPANCSTPPNARVVPDAIPDAGPLSGLAAGLRAMRHEWAIVVACDLPFLEPAVLGFLLERAAGCDAVVPLLGGRPQPVCAAYRRSALEAAESHLSAGQFSLSALLDALDVRWVADQELRAADVALRSFVNVNTPEEWERAQQ